MACNDSTTLTPVLEEMFTTIKASTSLAPRLGRLTLRGRNVIETPHYLANTSRGVVPHITQDNFAKDTSIKGVYVGLEDFIGARRTPPVAAPAANPNTNETVSVCTAVGFRFLRADDYAKAVEQLKADIIVGLGDIPYGRALGSKRVEKATDRNIAWIRDHVHLRTQAESVQQQAALFAPLLPVSCANQQYYIEALTEDVNSDCHGLALYDVVSLGDLPPKLHHLPRIGFTTPATPLEVLRHVSLGIDILTVPFVEAATDAGIALTFGFPVNISYAPDDSIPTPQQLGIDMWLATHAVDLKPIIEGCSCYTCTNHHRAYIQHLLAAKEMLGWVLLQIHNHHIIDLFFAGIRSSIEHDTFERDVQIFAKTYESDLPEKTGQGPRIRGYQFKSEGPGELKKNKAPFTMLNDGEEKLAEATPPSSDTDANVLQGEGFAEKIQ